MQRLTKIWLGLALWPVLGVLGAWAGPTGILRLDLEQAVPFTSTEVQRGGFHVGPPEDGTPAGRSRAGLEIDLRCEDGKFNEAGLAYCAPLPAAEHPVRVEQAEWTERGLRLVLEVGFLDELPRKLGGTGRYTVTLERWGAGWRGSYAGQIAVLAEKESKALWQQLGQEGAPRWAGRIEPGAVSSLTHVAVEAKPIRATAHWLGEPQPRWPAKLAELKAAGDYRSAGAWDCRYARARAEQGLAALGARDETGVLVAARVVRRFLLTGLGETGASNGQPEFAGALPVIREFVATYQKAHGIDLGAGTGLAGPAQPAAVVADRRMGSYVMRHGDFTVSFTAGGLVPARRGHFTLSGLGRDWIRESTNGYNVVQVHPAQVTRLPAAVPAAVGRIVRARLGRDGSGSVAMVGHGFVDGQGQEVGSIGYPYEPRSWRTMGVDFSGRSGAAAVLVFVEGHAGLGDRRQAWEADLGDVPAEQVKIDGNSFTVQAPGAAASLRGTVVYPVTTHIEYDPPQPGRGGRLRLWRTKPEKAADVELEANLDRKVEAVRLAFQRQVTENPEADLRLALEAELEDTAPSRAVRAQLERQHLSYFGKLYKHTTSTSMGSPNRAPQARESWVVVLTVQNGPAPVVEPLSFEEPALVKVGGQLVDHQEYLLEFREAP